MGTTVCQYSATVLSGHSLAEAMLVHAAAVVRLECSFHLLLIILLYVVTHEKAEMIYQSFHFELQNYAFLLK